MRFRNPAKRTWSTSWMRSTGLEASCRFHSTQILWQGFWISPPLKPQLFHNIENKHSSSIAICTCKISVLTSKLSNSISFKKSKINSLLNGKILRRFLLTRRRRKTCSEWENCPRGLCFPTALLSHWTEKNIKQSVDSQPPISVVFDHLSYVERSPRFTKAALCNCKMKKGTSSHFPNLHIWPAAPPQPQDTTLSHNFPEKCSKPWNQTEKNLKASAAPSTRAS